MPSPTYRYLKEQLAFSLAISDKHIERLFSLKKAYKDEINSPRRYENIHTVGELLKILEIRDVLSEDNVSLLKDITRRTSNSTEMLKMISDYEFNHMLKQKRETYCDLGRRVQNVPEDTFNAEGNILLQNTSNSNNCNINDIRKQRIYETVIEQIGTFWCILARKLKIRECDIDIINKNNDNLHDKAAKVIELYDRKADTKNWFLILTHALDNARREDLTKTIQDIMMMNM